MSNASSNAPAVVEAKPPRKKRLIEIFADRYHVDPTKVMATLKSTAFKQKSGEVTDDQMMALLIVANEYHLNPFTKEIYAFPDKSGIVPIVGLDGWTRIMNENPNFDGIDFEFSEEWAKIDEHHKPCPQSITCVIYRKDREHPIRVEEFLDEVYRPPFIGKEGQKGEYISMGPWQTHTKRMLRHKAMIQCGRVAFSFAGIFDADEGQQILEGSYTTIDEPTFDAIEHQEQDKPVTATSKLKDKLGMKVASEIEQPEEKPQVDPHEEVVVDPETGEVTTKMIDRSPDDGSDDAGYEAHLKEQAEAEKK